MKQFLGPNCISQVDSKQETLLGAVVDVHGYFLKSTWTNINVSYLIFILANSTLNTWSIPRHACCNPSYPLEDIPHGWSPRCLQGEVQQSAVGTGDRGAGASRPDAGCPPWRTRTPERRAAAADSSHSPAVNTKKIDTFTSWAANCITYSSSIPLNDLHNVQ